MSASPAGGVGAFFSPSFYCGFGCGLFWFLGWVFGLFFFFPLRRTFASQSVDGLGALGGRGVLPGAAGWEAEGLLLFFLSLERKLWGCSAELV